MSIRDLLSAQEITEKAKLLFQEERNKKRLDGWFLARESAFQSNAQEANAEQRAATELKAMITSIPLSISDHAIFAGTQSDAFAKTYALINPAFQVETFNGYCDPTSVFDDIIPNETLTKPRIDHIRARTRDTRYVQHLTQAYQEYDMYTEEVAFFFEQVTGHVIPDFRPVLKRGIAAIISETKEQIASEKSDEKRENLASMISAMQCAVLLAHRYADIAMKKAAQTTGNQKECYLLMEQTLRKVPEFPAESLYEAMQSFLLVWQVMCLEQAPNPFAFSVGNADRIFEPYRCMESADRAYTAALFKHFLSFFNVGDRSWAISQNVLIGGRDCDGNDLTNETSYAMLDAYYDMNLPQPILSVKLHKNTPQRLYQELGRFFFTPGCLTPSLFNDDSVFEVLHSSGISESDLPDYAVAGCQEPLIMGKDNGNTTNSWLNLPKILELTLTDGYSTITGKKIGPSTGLPIRERLENIRTLFYQNAEYFIEKMVEAANKASVAISYMPVPFLSAFMGGLETGYDMRDTTHQGTKYNGSGCLIHGLSVVADSFIAIDRLLEEKPDESEQLLAAISSNFEEFDDLQQFLLQCPKFGNNEVLPDQEAMQVAHRISDMVASQKNYLGNPFRPDWSSPSTHLLYGYWVGATPDGRKAREMLNYGIDPLFGDAHSGLGFRVLSTMQLPFMKMNGGYASHFGIDPKYFKAPDFEGKGEEFANRVIRPLFFNPEGPAVAPFYLYVNVTTPDTLRKVLENPKKYAPSGVYIMRIHGTFVNFLDLSPAIQQDIIKRLDLESTTI